MAVRSLEDDSETGMRRVRLRAGSTAGELARKAGSGLDEQSKCLGGIREGGIGR